MYDAMQFRNAELGGEARIIAYLNELATYAHAKLTTRWKTEAVAPANMTGGLLTVGLPIPSDWSEEMQKECATQIGTTLRDGYKMQIVPFVLGMNGSRRHVARISAQV